jgi:hypothetical protein
MVQVTQLPRPTEGQLQRACLLLLWPRELALNMLPALPAPPISDALFGNVCDLEVLEEEAASLPGCPQRPGPGASNVTDTGSHSLETRSLRWQHGQGWLLPRPLPQLLLSVCSRRLPLYVPGSQSLLLKGPQSYWSGPPSHP